MMNLNREITENMREGQSNSWQDLQMQKESKTRKENLQLKGSIANAGRGSPIQGKPTKFETKNIHLEEDFANARGESPIQDEH